MDGYLARLMSEHSVTSFVIVRDDATIADHQHRPDFSTSVPTLEEEVVVPQREAFEHPEEVKNSAPLLPCRKKSMDDLSVTLMRKSGNRHKRLISLNDAMLSNAIRNIVSNQHHHDHHTLPSVAEVNPATTTTTTSPRHNMLFNDIFRDVDELLKQTAF